MPLPPRRFPPRRPQRRKAIPAKKKVARAMPEGLTIGMKVKSSKDDHNFEVIWPDRSIKYVMLKNAERKRAVRAGQVLTPIKSRAKKTA